MKPTRRDLIVLLRQKMADKLKKELEDTRAAIPAPYDPDPDLKAAALSRFERSKSASKIVKALKAAKIPYRVVLNGSHTDAEARFRCSLSFDMPATEIHFPMPKRVAAKRAKSGEAYSKARNEHAEVQRKQETLRRTYTDDFLGTLLTELVTEGDENLRNLLTSLEARLLTKINETR